MFIIDPLTIVLTIVLWLIVVRTLYNQKRSSLYTNYPPGPKPLPIIGNLHIINLTKPYKTFLELSKQYGSVFTVHIGLEKTIVLCGYKTVKDALVNHAEEFSARPIIPIFHDITKEHGIVFSNGENWKVMRRFVLSTLRDLGVGKKLIEDKINEECDYLVERLNSYKGEAFDNTTAINSAVANIIVSIMLGHRFDYQDPTFVRLLGFIDRIIRLLGSSTVMIYNAFPSVLSWLPGNHKTVVKTARELQKFIKKTFTQPKENLDVTHKGNLIDTFFVKQLEEENNNGSYFHSDNLTTLVESLFIAGTETSSDTLRWGLLLMMKYPEIQKEVQKEIKKVIGSSQPQLEHRKSMPYTNAVIHEIQRFGNIVPLNIPRCTTQDVTFKGFLIPKGAYVIPLLASVLNDKDHFERPDEFYPQHFLDSEGNFVKNEAFLPFSAGKRSCIGENLAKMEMFLFFTRLLQIFTMQAPPGAELDLTAGIGFTTPPPIHKICALPHTQT
ncbi:hypothetical protein GDO86_010541 [Hymenochirus boettgeri]|uniref:Cytochrome P450 2K1-like n=1 Tax=Hymenochirus boettgeri TaxID=247094 RepID=A0A8T2JTG5_9PIPI|nr:hypothetical protein GDO86_010541 [Hymenochirus boettgeri]